MIQMNESMRQKQTHRHREQTCGSQGGKGVGVGWSGSLGSDPYKLLYIGWINNQDLLFGVCFFF